MTIVDPLRQRLWQAGIQKIQDDFAAFLPGIDDRIGIGQGNQDPSLTIGPAPEIQRLDGLPRDQFSNAGASARSFPFLTGGNTALGAVQADVFRPFQRDKDIVAFDPGFIGHRFQKIEITRSLPDASTV